MTSDKPSKTEDEYFTKRDLELLKQKREALEQEASKTERQQHFMKCPKCGADLASEQFHGITIDRCSECDGIWLDAGEIEQLVVDQEPGLLGRVFGDISAALGQRKRD
jgi:hypothetical protein